MQAWQAFRKGDTAEADRVLGEKPDSEIFHVPPARAASMRWRQASLGFVVLLFLGMMIVGRYPQILRPLFGRHAKPATRSAAATESVAHSNAAPSDVPSAGALEAALATNARAATNQLPHPGNP